LVADAGRIRQVLLNLAGNALKFTDQGAVTISARGTALGDGRMLLRWAVADTGPGILPEALDRLFQPFSQLDHGATRRHGGTGLGLAISKRLVEMMGGRVGVESRLGQGSIFWFELPLHRPAEGDPAPSPALAGKRLLLVDGDSDRRTHLAATLANAGLVVDAALPGDDARAAHGHALVLGMEGRTPDVRRWVTDSRSAGAAVLWCLPLDQHAAGSGAEEAIVLHLPLRTQRLLDALASALGAGQGRSEEVPALPRPPAGRQWRLLMALPDNHLRAEAGAVAARLGCTVRCAGDGDETLALARAEGFDLCLLGGPLGDRDPCDVAQGIRAGDGPNRLIPLVLIDTGAHPVDRRRCLAAGIDDHLPQPWSARAFAICLGRWFALAAGSR
jgi:CheY-like chemotaxis protein